MSRERVGVAVIGGSGLYEKDGLLVTIDGHRAVDAVAADVRAAVEKLRR